MSTASSSPSAESGAPILVAGGTGLLGVQVARLLRERGAAVRVLSREPERVRGRLCAGVTLLAGDVRDAATLPAAVAGARVVISAVHGFAGSGAESPKTVDWLGNRNLIEAARAAGVEQFVLVSVQGASPDHPIELFRMKYRAEQELRRSGLGWTIIRPTAFMELWVKLIGEPLCTAGATRIFGRGENPINFVSVYDVARYVARAACDTSLRGQVLEVGGPENLSLLQLAETFARVTGKHGTHRHVPLAMMRAMAVLLRRLKPSLARQIQAGVVMDTRDMRFDAGETFHRFPAIAPTSLAEMIRRDYGGRA